MIAIPQTVGVILVDHGSTYEAANELLIQVVALYRRFSGALIVEPAHMDIAEPTIEQAFSRCVDQGATTVVIHPYFLSPGRHSITDIPNLAEQAARKFPDVPYRVTEPLGLDTDICSVIHKRVLRALDGFVV